MSRVTEVKKTIDLDDYDLERVPSELVDELKEEVGEYIVNEIKRYTRRGESPVQGEGRFRILNPDYAKKQKNGVRTSNMRLEGDLIDDLRFFDENGNKLAIGHEGTEAPKADGHNQLSGEAKSWAKSKDFPKRRYIPDSRQKFKNEIENGIKDIVERYRTPEPEEVTIDLGGILGTTQTPDEVGVQVGGAGQFDTIGLFDDEGIEFLLADALRRRG